MATVQELTGLGMPPALAEKLADNSVVTSGEYIVSTTLQGVRSDTSDGADDKRVRIAGGGAYDEARGAYIDLQGNEAGGNLLLLSGNTANSNIDLRPMNSTSSFRVRNAADVVAFSVNYASKFTVNFSNAGATGNVTLNVPMGYVQMAAGASSLTLTNSLISTTSHIFCTVQTNDATAKSALAVPGAGSAVIATNANATATTRIAFWVFN